MRISNTARRDVPSYSQNDDCDVLVLLFVVFIFLVILTIAIVAVASY